MFGLPSGWAVQCQVVCEEDSRGTISLYIYICIFFSKQLLKAQLYVLILSEDAAIHIAVALRRENKPALLGKA